MVVSMALWPGEYLKCMNNMKPDNYKATPPLFCSFVICYCKLIELWHMLLVKVTMSTIYANLNSPSRVTNY